MNHYKRALVIINPAAGQKSANRHLTAIVEGLFSNGYVPTVVTTTKELGGNTLVKQHSAGADLIVCIGGDGTLHQVIDGVIQICPHTPVGYIGAGTTNDFAKNLGIPSEISKALHNILAGTPKEVDIGRFEHTHFTYVASCGAFTDTSYNASRSLKNVIGHLAYILEGIRSLSEIHPIHLKIETEHGIHEDDYIFAAICNTTSLGGVLQLKSDDISFSDGMFEMLLIRYPQNMIDLTKILLSLQMKEYKEPHMQFFRTSQARIHGPEQLHWSLDGEHMASSGTVSFNVIPRAVSLILPQRKKKKALLPSKKKEENKS